MRWRFMFLGLEIKDLNIYFFYFIGEEVLGIFLGIDDLELDFWDEFLGIIWWDLGFGFGSLN